jgi:hypothetical protein
MLLLPHHLQPVHFDTTRRGKTISEWLFMFFEQQEEGYNEAWRWLEQRLQMRSEGATLETLDDALVRNGFDTPAELQKFWHEILTANCEEVNEYA